MKRARIPQTLLAALLASAAAGAAPIAETHGGAAPLAFNGLYLVTFTVNAGAALAPGSTILCKAKAAPSTGPLDEFQWKATPVASGIATVNRSRATGATGSWANCTVEVPFYWAASETQGGAVLSYEIDLVSGAGDSAEPLRRQEAVSLPYPAPGGSARLSFDVSF
jgi:hypothetical protein